MTGFPLYCAFLLAIPFASLLALPAEAQRLLRDDFEQPTLDSTKWVVPEGDGTFFGRTQIRPPSSKLRIDGGSLRLQLDTYNPWGLKPGDSFLGSQIDTVEPYDLEDGLIIEASVRFVSPLPRGLVGSLFTFGLSGAIRDEIDFELLSNDWVDGKPRVFTNVFDDNDFQFPGIQKHADAPNLDLDGFHVYRIEWFEDRVKWKIDSKLVREETATVPDGPQHVSLNFWAPDAFFAAAYDENLTPSATPENNQVYFYEVDWVKIRRPLPLMARLRPWIGAGLIGLTGLVLAIMIARRVRS